MKKNWMLTLALSLSSVAFGQDSLPKDIKWLSNDNPPAIGDSSAQKGGTLNLYIGEFPATLRAVGPDSNGSFRSQLDANSMSLINIHPNTEEVVPEIATHWAYGSDNKTMYYKINPLAKWSDGKPVIADDFIFNLEFHRSKDIVAPWYNEYYSTQFDRIIKYDDLTIAIVMKEPKPELHLYANISPIPKHYYGKVTADFVKKYNWEIVPNTGAYELKEVNKGKSLVWARKKDWWAKDMPFYRGRFNVDKIVFQVIRENTVALEHLRRGAIDLMFATWPDYWYEKMKGGPFADGYIHKLWFYTDGPADDYALEMNTNVPLLADINVRLGIQHAVNVEKVIEKVLRGDYERLQGVAQGMGKFTNPNVRAFTFDLKKANEYFDKAGFTTWGSDGIRMKGTQRLSATVTYGAEQVQERLVVMREEVKKAGFELNLQLLDSAASFKSFLEKKHQIAFMAWNAQIRPEYWSRFHKSNADKPQTNNFTNIKDDELSDWAVAFRDSQKIEERHVLSHKIQQKIHDLAIIVPLFRVPYFRTAHWRYIRTPKVAATKLSSSLDVFEMSSGGLFWIDEKLKTETLAAKKASQKFPEVVNVDKTFKVK
jgi:microcin C transport system substrate-binding protein